MIAHVAPAAHRIAPDLATLRNPFRNGRPAMPAARVRKSAKSRAEALWFAGSARVAAHTRASLVWLRQRVAARPAPSEAQGSLCLSVSESGWRATLQPADGSAPIETAERAAPDEAPLSTPDMLRRATRAITPATRDRIGSLRLLVHDRAAILVDNRALKLRGTEVATVRQAGAHELGSPTAVHAFQPFGNSSEHEVERGVYAFLPAERIADYLGALDSLAVKLTAVVPARLLYLQAQQPFAAIEVRAASLTFVLADPDSGAVACREFPVGTRSFAEALARATSISVREAAEGLERRLCLTPGTAALGVPTTTELALAPLLDTLRGELLATFDYFVFQRLAGAPERLLVSGDAARVRGLAEWLGGILKLPPQPAPELALPPAASDDAAARQTLNMLQDTPVGLLRIGRTDYRFAEGRFQSVQAQSRSEKPSHPSLHHLARQTLTLQVMRQMAAVLAAVPAREAVAPSLAFAATGLMLWATLGAAADGKLQALDQLSQRIASRATLQHAALHPRNLVPVTLAPQPWTAMLSRVAALIPGDVWLTSLTTVTDPAASARQRVLLEGAVRADPGEDYIANVAGFIDRLQSDPVFMTGVASIDFEGASLAQGPATDVAGFTISVTLAPAFTNPQLAGQAASSQPALTPR